jgi:two-component system sensor histidine kinase RegB
MDGRVKPGHDERFDGLLPRRLPAPIVWAMASSDTAMSSVPSREVMFPTARGRVRLGTLNNLRWMAVIGQSTALILVYFVMGYALPLTLCATAIGASALLNATLSFAYPVTRRLKAHEATAFLAYDILQLAALLYLTGGVTNPFSLLFVAPVVISAATLELADTLLLATLAFTAISFLVEYHRPLPWRPDEVFTLPPVYVFGIWVSLIAGIGFTSIYAWRTANESARMAEALSATQLALARADRLAALGALATAAAHELGSPLGTIAVVAHELARETPQDAPHADDFLLLRAEAERCRKILTRLAQPDDAVIGMTNHLPLGALLDDIAEPHRGLDLEIAVQAQPGTPPRVWRVPEISYGLNNLVENATDFAVAKIRLLARWDAKTITVDVIDDGPGFAPEILERIGDPYVTSRPRGRTAAKDMERDHQEGMGLGFFIAKTLLEQTGASVSAHNAPEGGALVRVVWPRGAIDGETPPTKEET